MGLKCRLLGHEFGDPEIERERQENGDEVVVTIRELQVCERCGAEHLVSENKEVTSIRSPSEVGLDEGGASGGPSAGAASTPDPSPAQGTTPAEAEPSETQSVPSANRPPSGGDDPASHISEAEPNARSVGSDPSPADARADADADADDDFEPPQDPDEDDAVILDDDGDERDSTQWPEETAADPAAAAEESAAAEDVPEDLPRDGDGEPVTDDAELIDADETQSVSSADQNASRSGDGDAEAPEDRGHGEWPARESTPADEGGSNAPWPEHADEDEGFDAEPSDGTPADVAFGGGLTPETNGHAESLDDADGVVSSDEGFTRADEDVELEADVPDERVEFYCPNCEHARTAGASSMRAGDICPECKRGYIAERQL